MVLSDSFIKKLKSKEIEGLYNEPMKNHTSYKIGGPAKAVVIPKDTEELRFVLNAVKEENYPYFIIGNGTNLLALDEGVDAIVIKIRGGMAHLIVEDEKFYVGAGALLSKAADYASERGLSGMEAISGIFGTIGGAISMNAGAYGAEIKDIIESVTYLNENGEEVTISKEECDFGYRTSIFSKKGYVVLSAVFKLKKDKKEEIKGKMMAYGKQRADKQPLNYPSCGSVFKRPEGYFAGALIEQAGLKGVTVGGAQVSEKHAGFIVNIGGATAKDVIDLIKIIKDTVLLESGITLECEMRTIPPIKL